MFAGVALLFLLAHRRSLLLLLQNALAKATVRELATLHGTKYTYGPGATTICESAVRARAPRGSTGSPESSLSDLLKHVALAWPGYFSVFYKTWHQFSVQIKRGKYLAFNPRRHWLSETPVEHLRCASPDWVLGRKGRRERRRAKEEGKEGTSTVFKERSAGKQETRTWVT